MFSPDPPDASPFVFTFQLTSNATRPVNSCCITIVQVTQPSSGSPADFSRMGTGVEAPPGIRVVVI